MKRQFVTVTSKCIKEMYKYQKVILKTHSNTCGNAPSPPLMGVGFIHKLLSVKSWILLCLAIIA